jgi:phenylacetate-CoA ligase
MTEHFRRAGNARSAAREAALMAALPAQVAHAQQAAAAFADILRGVDAAGITSRAALARLPVTRKGELFERQKAQRASDVFGGFATTLRGGRPCAASTPRPARSTNPRAPRADYWRTARAMFAAGFRAGDLVHNASATT